MSAIAMHTQLQQTQLVSQSVGGTRTVQAAIDRFIAQDYGKVVASVAVATGGHDLAEDGVQDALVKALSADQPPDNLAAWVTVVAANEVRQTQRRKSIEVRVTGGANAPETTTDLGDLAVSVDIARAFAELPPRQRDIAMMYYYLDIAVADIAQALNITEGTVKTQLHRARDTLADLLTESEVPDES